MTMEPKILDIDSLIAQTTALTWEDPFSQLESIPFELGCTELLPLVGKVISHKTHNNQSVNAALSKAWFFAIPFSFAMLRPNLFLFKFSKKEHASKILKNVPNVNGYLLSIQAWPPLYYLRRPLSLNCPFLDSDSWTPSKILDHQKCHSYWERLRLSTHGGGQQWDGSHL